MSNQPAARCIGLFALAWLLGCSAAEEGPREIAMTSGGVANAVGSRLDAPDQSDALLAFLERKQYADWSKETEVHPSAGPHGAGVRVYYSPNAAVALQHGARTFPVGAASVKELITSDGALYGYSVWVKVQDDSDGGNGFFWYERIRRSHGSDAVYGNARGSRVCVDCHSAGNDYSLSTLPFE